MIRYSVTDTLLPLLSSLHVSSRTYIKKDKWGYNYVPQPTKPVQWKRDAPKAEVVENVPPPLLTRQSRDTFLERLRVDRTRLGRQFERAASNTELTPVQYKPGMMRSGIIGVKQGQTRLFLRDGKVDVGTMISIMPNYILSARRHYGKRNALLSDNKHYKQTIASVDEPFIDKLSLPKQKYYYAAGIPPKRFSWSFTVTEENLLPEGYKLDTSHLFAGQYVDITAKTIYRGFQGVIRRWGYKGQGFNQGRTKTHRRPGSIGTQGLRRVMKGKNMPGIMGDRIVTDRGYKVVYANYERGYIIVQGVTPGAVGGAMYLTDARGKRSLQAEYLHYPTFLLEGAVLKEHYDGAIISPTEPTTDLIT